MEHKKADDHSMLIFNKVYTKPEIHFMAKENAKADVDGGEKSLRHAYALAKSIHEYVTQYMSELKPGVIDELTLEDEKTFSIDDKMKLSISNSGDRLDYGMDKVWRDLDKAKKDREELLKARFKGMNVADADGVEVPLIKVKSYGGEIVKVTF